QCLVRTERVADASKSFELAIELNPKQFNAYGRLAQLIRQFPGKMKAEEANAKADAVVAKMLAKNPKSAVAHLVAAGYWKGAAEPTKYASEIELARDCDPTDLEVVLAVAELERS